MVIYRRGAGLETLWEIIEWNILTKHFDYVFLLGGVCNMTDKVIIDGRREFWPPADLDGRFARIHQLIRDIARNFKLLKTNAKLILLLEPGLDLIKLNRVPHPVPWRTLVVQSELEERLDLLRLYTRVINSYLGVITPWTLDLTHSYRNHEVHPVYDRLRDGIHFTGAQVVGLAKILAEYVENDIAKSRSFDADILNITMDLTYFTSFIILDRSYYILMTTLWWYVIALVFTVNDNLASIPTAHSYVTLILFQVTRKPLRGLGSTRWTLIITSNNDLKTSVTCMTDTAARKLACLSITISNSRTLNVSTRIDQYV